MTTAGRSLWSQFFSFPLTSMDKSAARHEAHFRIPDAENGLATEYHNGRPNKSDVMLKLLKDDMPGELRERLARAIENPGDGD